LSYARLDLLADLLQDCATDEQKAKLLETEDSDQTEVDHLMSARSATQHALKILEQYLERSTSPIVL
jgi:hypothetical protein